MTLTCIQGLQPGESFTFPDQTVLKAEDVLRTRRKGRKIVIMGDTSSGHLIAPFAAGADVLVHEATNTWIPELEQNSGIKNAQDLERMCRKHGHSTADMAGRFAAEIGAKTLFLTHFSARYSGDRNNTFAVAIMDRIVRRAALAASKMGSRLIELNDDVINSKDSSENQKMLISAAYDGMVHNMMLPHRHEGAGDSDSSDSEAADDSSS